MEDIKRLTDQLTDLQSDDNTPAWAKVLIQCVGQLVEIVTTNNTLSNKIETLEDDVKSLKKELASVRQSADDNEQKSRTSCLLLHGIEEKDGEDTDTICIDIVTDEVGVNLTKADIERSHRVGPKRPPTRSSKPRPIIFRFASMRKRIEVYSNKRELKGKNIVLTESLTQARYTLFQEAKTKYGYKNVWTSEGRIFTKLNNKFKHISSVEDLK